MKKYFALAAVATMFAACTNEEVTQAESLKDTPITIASAGVGELTASRTTTDDVENHPFGLFVESTSGETKYEATNMKWTNNNGWGSDETLLFEGAGKQTAYAYHPYAENATANYTFTTNGTTDLLWWKSESTLTGNSLSIEFSHALSKLTVNLKKNSEVGDVDLGNVTIGGTILTGTANLAEQTWTLDENATASNISTTGITATTGYDKTVEVLLLPQTATFSVMIEVGEKTYIWTSAGQTFVPGTAYTLNLTVGKDVTAVTDVRVADWGEAQDINGGMAMEDFGYSYDEQTNTYTVWNANGLYVWNEAARTNLSTNLILTADITLPTVEDGESNWEIVGTGSKQYSGTIDGNYHTISGLQMNYTSNNWISFAGFVDVQSTIKNLTFANVHISGQQYIGVVAGISNGTITNCHVTSGMVTGKNNMTAGIVGSAGGSVSGCTNAASVNGGSVAGGIAGNTENNGIVAACSNMGAVSVTGSSVGGIVGGHAGNSIIGCWNTTGVNVIGNGSGTITHCYSGDATTINGKVEDMNTALGTTYGYQWQAGANGGYPTLVKSE